jgi:hypothetical protein
VLFAALFHLRLGQAGQFHGVIPSFTNHRILPIAISSGFVPQLYDEKGVISILNAPKPVFLDPNDSRGFPTVIRDEKTLPEGSGSGVNAGITYC